MKPQQIAVFAQYFECNFANLQRPSSSPSPCETEDDRGVVLLNGEVWNNVVVEVGSNLSALECARRVTRGTLTAPLTIALL